MPGFKATVGNVELVSVKDGDTTRPPVQMFPESTIEQWRSDFPELLNADDEIEMRYGSVVVRSGGKLILVDTGIGQPDGIMMDELRQRGIDREAVEIVFMTHLHWDHVGWNMSDGSPTFPRARYLVPRADWEHWTQPSVLEGAPQMRDQVMPLDELRIMDLIDDGYRITDEVTAVSTPGHTPGHTSVRISSAGQHGFILGDAAHNVAQAHYTDLNAGVDTDQAQSRRTRTELFDRLEAEGALVSAGHFPEPGFGRFVRVQGRRVWQGV